MRTRPRRGRRRPGGSSKGAARALAASPFASSHVSTACSRNRRHALGLGRCLVVLRLDVLADCFGPARLVLRENLRLRTTRYHRGPRPALRFARSRLGRPRAVHPCSENVHVGTDAETPSVRAGQVRDEQLATGERLAFSRAIARDRSLVVLATLLGRLPRSRRGESLARGPDELPGGGVHGLLTQLDERLERVLGRPHGPASIPHGLPLGRCRAQDGS